MVSRSPALSCHLEQSLEKATSAMDALPSLSGQSGSQCTVYLKVCTLKLQESGSNPVFSAEMEAVAWPAHYKRQAASRQSSGNGSAHNGSTPPANGTTPKSSHEPPEAQAAFCFAVSDGRLGSITVTDRGVKKRPVTAPHWTVQYVDRLVVTSIAAMGDLVFIGDSQGVLYQWNTVSGQTMVVPAGRKVIRKISVGPPVPAALRTGHAVGAGLARLVLLYGDGTLGVRFRTFPAF
jgi:hypothetical protein